MENLPDMKTAMKSGRRSKTQDTAAITENQDLEFCKKKGSEAWKALSLFLKERDLLHGKQRNQCLHMSRMLEHEKREPSAALCSVCKKIWLAAEGGYGWSA